MKTLIFGAGPMGSLYAHLMCQAGKDVTILARGKRYEFIKTKGLELVNEITGGRGASKLRVVNELKEDDEYDLVVVLIRKNKLLPVFEVLRTNANIKNVLFMGNNTLGFVDYVRYLPKEKLLFGFPGAGGGISEQVVHYADREKPKDKRRPVTIGEIDGKTKRRTQEIKALFQMSGIPVNLVGDIDGWLKYHVALISPLCNALYKHNCDNYSLAKDKKTIKVMVQAVKEGGRVLKALGYTKRYPFKFNLFYWLPEMLNVKAVEGLLESKFAEVAFSLHAMAAQDEMRELSVEFQTLINKTSVETPNIVTLRNFIP
ncbi:MAG: hypothetical protein GTN99_10135 [Candidatus Dadabacteria bacterium]|nr:hypothetical protein [Gammaproteobacteria bacterium]NIT05936.1 hypothetical protein [Gammaproteobacteria bacterium]NIT14573.1 hypothetical protein [Candidatus Dadabacteria bacterium]